MIKALFTLTLLTTTLAYGSEQEKIPFEDKELSVKEQKEIIQKNINDLTLERKKVSERRDGLVNPVSLWNERIDLSLGLTNNTDKLQRDWNLQLVDLSQKIEELTKNLESFGDDA